ncbi:MAG TPA: NAD(P)-dependent oxidoreductase [Rhizomicrobium sp.]|nr:NAD(P)-dependent oxidoreductase [Rhizomicrobium sp.]
MFPIALDPTVLRIGLAGAGHEAARRREALEQGGVSPLSVAPEDALDGLNILFVAGIERARAELLAARARAAGVLVNVEDMPELCDFHVPATVRRGDLAITVSTSGRAPALSRLLREWLERIVVPEWKDRLDQAARARAAWRAEGLSPGEVSTRMRALAAREGWLS